MYIIHKSWFLNKLNYLEFFTFFQLEYSKDDVIGQYLERNKMQQAMELLHSEDLPFSILNSIVGHIAR